jgi:glyoxylase-like metal-dependent hydrolase (beta-lactamase superfamily II)
MKTEAGMAQSLTRAGEVAALPTGMRVFERGWLSANGILFEGPEGTALVDTGYASHSAQTVALVQAALGTKPLARILNTHLHSDHCGGNAALQQVFPEVSTLIPPGQARFVRDWDPVALTYSPTGQQCPAFRFDGLLQPGATVTLGSRRWQIHAAPGHDPHSIILFEPESGLLLSADALWENGFGVIFEELEGEAAFREVAATLALIEQLAPRAVVPGHGRVFTDVVRALAVARARLEAFERDPRKHARHAAKVLLKFKLLEVQQVVESDLQRWVASTPYFGLVHRRFFAPTGMGQWTAELIAELERNGAARRSGEDIFNA